MALFFVSFRRNPVCDALNLPRFPLSSRERSRIQSGSNANSGNSEFVLSAEKVHFSRHSAYSFQNDWSSRRFIRNNLCQKHKHVYKVRLTHRIFDHFLCSRASATYQKILSLPYRSDLKNLEKMLSKNPKFSTLSLDEQRLHICLTESDSLEVEAAMLAAQKNAEEVQAALRSGEYDSSNALLVENDEKFLYPQFMKFKEGAQTSWTASLQKAAGEVHLEIALLEAGV